MGWVGVVSSSFFAGQRPDFERSPGGWVVRAAMPETALAPLPTTPAPSPPLPRPLAAGRTMRVTSPDTSAGHPSRQAKVDKFDDAMAGIVGFDLLLIGFWSD